MQNLLSNHDTFILNHDLYVHQAIRLPKALRRTARSAGIFKATIQPADTTDRHHMSPSVSVSDLRQSANPLRVQLKASFVSVFLRLSRWDKSCSYTWMTHTHTESHFRNQHRIVPQSSNWFIGTLHLRSTTAYKWKMINIAYYANWVASSSHSTRSH